MVQTLEIKEELLLQHDLHLKALPNNDISTRGKPALTSMIGAESKIINKLKTVHATHVNSRGAFSVPWD